MRVRIRSRLLMSLMAGIFALFLITSAAMAQGVVGPRVTSSFDRDWRFYKGDAAGAEVTDFNDVGWRKVDAPHDWSIEGPVDEKNPTGQGGGFMPSGVGWYRKHFTLSNDFRDRLVFIEFDGVMANSDVWINGFHLGHRPYGYVSFSYELTPHFNFGRDNVIAVRADTSKQPASRWYTGAGIYRHVRLVTKDAAHIPEWGTFVSTPRVEEKEALVSVTTEVLNQSSSPQSVSLRVKLLDLNGRIVQAGETSAGTIEPGKVLSFKKDLTIINPIRWDIVNPALYRAIASVRVNGNRTTDEEIVSFGIREVHFDPATGFWLNGKNFKIKGV